MNHNTQRVRHRSLRISSKGKTSGTTSQFTLRMGSVPFPHANNIALQSISIPQMVPNIYSGNNCFILYHKEYMEFVSGVNDNIIIKIVDTGQLYAYNVGNLSITPATIAADLATIEAGINGLIFPSQIDLGYASAGPTAESYIVVSLVSGPAVQFIKTDANTSGLLLGNYTADSPIIDSLTPARFPNPLGGVKIQIESFQYTYDQLRPVLQAAIDAAIAPETATVEKNSTVDPSRPFDDRLHITFTGLGVWTFSTLENGSTMSPALGFNVLQSSPLAPAQVQLFGIKEYYLHCKQTNHQKTQLESGRPVSIHAVIPTSVSYGSLLTFTAPHHDFFRVAINNGSNQMKDLTFTLRDVNGIQLKELDNYEYSMILDLDILTKR